MTTGCRSCGGCCGSRLLSGLLLVHIESLAHIVADSHPGTDTGSQSGTAAFILRSVAHSVGSLQLGVGVHVQHTHRAQVFRTGFGRFEIGDIEGLQHQTDGGKVILCLGADSGTEFFRQAEQLEDVLSLGGHGRERILQLGKQHRAQTVFNGCHCIAAGRTNDLRNELLRVADLETVGTEALQQGHSQTDTGVLDDDRLCGAPFAVGKFAHGDIIHFRGEGSTIIESLAEQVGEQRQVRGGNGMTAGTEHIQCLPVTEENSIL